MANPCPEPGLPTPTLRQSEEKAENGLISADNYTESAEVDVNSASLPPPPPDGGVQAWTQVLMGHLVLINGWGYLSSFGLFQSYYTTSLGASPSAISWIGSLQIFLVYLVGTFSGRALDAGYFHVVLGLGSFLQILGVFMTSVSSQYWQLLLAQGVCKGLGDGLVFCPTVSLVATYFSKKRSLAMACTASGGATGGIIFPVIAQQLLPKIGFGWTVRIMGFVILFNAVVGLLIARVRLPPRKTGPLVEWSAFKEPSYTLFCVGMYFNLWAVYFAYFYVSTFGKKIIGVSSSTSLTILLVMNAVGVPGRLVCGLTADRLLGPVNTLIPVAFFAGVLFYCWAAVSSLGALFAFCIIYGFFGAGIQSLFPASCASLTTDLKKMGVRTGMCFSVVSIACLTGPPIAGALIQQHNGGFLYAQMFGGSAFMGGTLTLVAARIAKSGLELKSRM
ncbi:major facilitator superfamily domain-containing protein [Phyllosticta citrichinensis]|uniref:Major facilitator superfamily domain-containing protein n=1 Tax=Phyllosticta citrichinensis TaxID=1130410 RepID=A0ABR1XRT9_9PEZI